MELFQVAKVLNRGCWFILLGRILLNRLLWPSLPPLAIVSTTLFCVVIVFWSLAIILGVIAIVKASLNNKRVRALIDVSFAIIGLVAFGSLVVMQSISG